MNTVLNDATMRSPSLSLPLSLSLSPPSLPPSLPPSFHPSLSAVLANSSEHIELPQEGEARGAAVVQPQGA